MPTSMVASLARILREKNTQPMRPGGLSKVLHRIAPAERQQIMANVDAVHEYKELGHHAGDPRFGPDPVKARGLHRESLDKLVDGALTDHVSQALQQRRGSDADLPIPEPDRRDHLRAALDAHNYEE
jgi:hypothetical protein